MNRHQKILTTYLGILIVYWVILALSGLQTSFWNYFYSFAFSLIPLIGGLVGMLLARPWGYLSSAIGKAILATSFGSFCWGAGSMIWSYYNFFFNISAPYPSLADVGFILAIPFWLIGMISLSKATGAKFGLKNMKGKIFLILASVALLVVSYYLLVIVARGGILTSSFDDLLKLFFDLAYPAGDVLILILAVAVFGLSFEYFGGIYKVSIYTLLAGFAVMYLADFIFSYTTTIETFYNGNFGDLVFTLALYLITVGVFGFSKPPIREIA